MKSKIQIDLDWDNQPIIKIEYVESDDVRDKMVKRFMQSFQSESYIAKFFFHNTVEDTQQNSKAAIRPLPPCEFIEHKEYFESMCKKSENDILHYTKKEND